jgi:hypothetical protein
MAGIIFYLIHTQVPQSSVAAEQTPYNWSGEARIGRTTTAKILTHLEFVMVQQSWAVVDYRFDKLLDDYKKATKKMRVKPTMKQWQVAASVTQGWPAADREAMLLMTQMSRKCRVHMHHTYSDIYK